jgi:hypothetical protein
MIIFQTFMLEAYRHPSPMAEDLFLKYNIPAEHGYFILGTKGTGKQI